MHVPDGLATLFDDGIIERVVRPLMSGKEAQVYLVIARGQLCVAKVYKEAQQRTFKNRAAYTEGRKTRNVRDQRAIDKRSKHGREQDEAAWRSTEVDMIHRLHAGGVRVPTPYAFVDGVLVMECIADAEGNPAPRLSDVALAPAAAQAMYEQVMREVVRMLAVGVVHGDLSDFNILLGADGPVIIDFPQSVDTARNTNARRLLLRDVANVHRFLTRFVPHAPRRQYAEEMWDLHEQNALTADTRLTGRHHSVERRASNESVLELIRDADYDEQKRRAALGLRGGPPPTADPQASRGQRQGPPHQQRQGPPQQQRQGPPQQQRQGPPQQQRQGPPQQQRQGPPQQQPQQRSGQQGGRPPPAQSPPLKRADQPPSGARKHAPEVIIVRRPPR